MKLVYLFCVLLVPVLCVKDDAVASFVQAQNGTQVDTELPTEKPAGTDANAGQLDSTSVPNYDKLQYPQEYPTPSYPGQPGQIYPDQGYPGQNYPGQGYPGQGYPGQGYQEQGYTGQGYPGQYNGGLFYPGQSYSSSYGQPYAGTYGQSFYPNVFPWSFSPQNMYPSIAQHNYELSKQISESINQQMQRTQEMNNAIQENIRNNLYQQAMYNNYANFVPYYPNSFVVPQTADGYTNPEVNDNKEATSNETAAETTEESVSTSSSSNSISSNYKPASATVQKESNTIENKEPTGEATTQFVDIIDVRTKDRNDTEVKTSDTKSTTTAKPKEVSSTSPKLTEKFLSTTERHTTMKQITTTKAKTPELRTTTTAPRSKAEKPKPQSTTTTTSNPKSTTDGSAVFFRDSNDELNVASRLIIPKLDPSAPCVYPLVKDENGKCINSRENFKGGCPGGQMRAGDNTCQDVV